jgi:protein-L-isoaspartate O-methyltransferase
VTNALEQQLKIRGKLAHPVGAQNGAQTLYVLEKQPDGSFNRRAILAVRFVPLTGGARLQ